MGERHWGKGGEEGEWIKVTQSDEGSKEQEARVSQEQMFQESEALRKKDSKVSGEEVLVDLQRALRGENKRQTGNN